MNYKTLLFLLLIPTITIGMESQESMTEIKTMEEAKQFAGKIVACKPRIRLGESLVDPKGQEINFAYINPTIDYYWHKEAQIEELYHYFHVLNRHKNPIVTRVISAKTLAQEPLTLRLANDQEKEQVYKRLIDPSDGQTYTFEFSKHSDYNESCFTCKRLNVSDLTLKEALGIAQRS